MYQYLLRRKEAYRNQSDELNRLLSVIGAFFNSGR